MVERAMMIRRALRSFTGTDRYTMTAYVGDRRLYGWGVYAATHFDILVEVALNLPPDSTLIGSNHGNWCGT